MAGECRHCGPSVHPLVAKGLCRKCYYTDGIRALYAKKVLTKEWTRTERRDLKELRHVGYSFKQCAEFFNTSPEQVKVACRKYKISTLLYKRKRPT